MLVAKPLGMRRCERDRFDKESHRVLAKGLPDDAKEKDPAHGSPMTMRFRSPRKSKGAAIQSRTPKEGEGGGSYRMVSRRLQETWTSITCEICFM